MDTLFSIQIMDQMNQGNLLHGVKWIIVFAFGLSLIFSMVIITQINRMFNVLSTGAKKYLYFLSASHLFLSIAALLWAIVVL